MTVPTKKKTAKKPAAKPKSVLRTLHPATIQDFFDQETKELLNPKHEMFAQVWVQTFNKRDALMAINSKFRDDYYGIYHAARSLFKREDIQLRIREILRERVRDIAVTEEFVVLGLLDIHRKGLESKPVLDNEGNIVGSEYVDLKVSASSLERIGQAIGMFQKKETPPAQNITFNLNYGTPEAAQLPQAREALTGESKRLQ